MRVVRRVLLAWASVGACLLTVLGIIDTLHGGTQYAATFHQAEWESFGRKHPEEWVTLVWRTDRLGRTYVKRDDGRWEELIVKRSDGRRVGRYQVYGKHKKTYALVGSVVVFLVVTALAIPKGRNESPVGGSKA